MFGKFLEGLAIYVAEIFNNGVKSSTQGVDLDLTRDGTRYLIAIKSGPNWGNSSQYGQLRSDMQIAVKVLHQSRSIGHIQPILGCCYGKVRTINTGLYIKMAGQAFWEFLTEDDRFYIDIVEPIGKDAKKHSDDYAAERALSVQSFALEIINDFCLPNGAVDWEKLLVFNSGEFK